MNEQIMLSIITPTHDPDLAIFRRTAESVMTLLKKDWEWVVVLHNTDVPGQDEFLRLIRESCPSGQTENVRILTLHDAVRSPAAPRNYGLTQARGKYVCFLDHDDVLEPAFLLAALQTMEAEDCDVFIGSAKKELTAPGLFEVPVGLDFPNTGTVYEVPADPELRGKLLVGAGIMLSCKVIRRDLLMLHEIRFDPDIQLTEDVLFALRCYCKARKIMVAPHLVAYTYVQNENSLLQRMMGEDSFPPETYTEPVRRIVNLALENNISPSDYLWMMMGMFTVIYQRGAMAQEKKRLLMSEIQKYIPLMKLRTRTKKSEAGKAEQHVSQ